MTKELFVALLFAVALNAETGSLMIRGTGAECPLRRTNVQAEISGSVARVTLTQEFENTATDRIEAVYVFPLPHSAAVDSMTLTSGTRVIKGKVLRRDEAQAIYEAARDSGRQAALLDQERPNLFTQRVTGIGPGERVRVTIGWNQRIPYESGTYEWAFPMVVGPRYKSAVRTTYVETGKRAGHDISIEVTLDAGMPLEWFGSPSHDVVVDRPAPGKASIRLRNGTTIPNKDFIVRYDAAGKTIADAVLTHRSARGGYFALMLQPPESFSTRDLTPKEIVFVLDTSGSMNGFPMEKAKEAMSFAIGSLNPHDMFNLITFSGDTRILFPQPVPATQHNVARAKEFLAERRGAGGTEMMKAVRAALEPSQSQRHIRIACFMTDGYVGNEDEILAAIRTYANARVFAFGIGNSVNRYLLDRMAEEGRGEVEYVSLNADGSAAARRFHERVRNPLLTDIRVDWGSLPVTDVVPERIPDLFSAKAIVLFGRYNGSGGGKVKVHGKLAGAPWSREVVVNLPAVDNAHTALPGLWARTKVDSLWGQPDAEAQVTQLGLEYGLMTPFTSFVAVEEKTITDGGKPRRVDVPLEMPDGVDDRGIFGQQALAAPMAASTMHFQGIAQTIRVAPSLAREARVKSRLHPDLKGRSGAVRIQIWLRSKDAAVVGKLKALGFVVTAQPASMKMLVGRIDASKLSELAQLTEVTWIAPAP